MKLKISSFFSKLFIKNLYRILFIGAGLLIINSSYASDRYFLCGPDEDGCFDDITQYCACIPYNDLEANSPHCFNINNLTCTPLSQAPNCDPSFVFKNQGECLATIYQSIPFPPCKITTRSFCLENHTSICDANGQPSTCH